MFKLNKIIKRFLGGNLPYCWLTLIITLLYARTMGYGFSPLDDPIIIIDKIDWLRNPANFFSIFTQEYHLNLYRPILILSFFFDANIGKGLPIIFHLNNILLHISVTLLLYHLLVLISKKLGSAFILSILFAIHPVHIHAVAWIPGRNDIILALMSLSAMITFIRFMLTGKRSLLIYHILFFTLAMFSKETAIIIPILTLLASQLIFKDNFKKLKIVLLLQSIVVAIWFISKINISPLTVDIRFVQYKDLFQNLFIFFISSIGKSVFPYQQAITPFFLHIPISYLIISFFFIIWFILKRDQIYGWAIVGIVWYILFLLPGGLWTIFIIRDNIFYEHRLYVPLVGLAILLHNIPVKMKYEKYFLTGLFFIFVTLSFYQNYTRVEYYSDESLFAYQCLSETPNCAKSALIHGELSYRNSDISSAVKDFTSAIKLYPDNYKIYNRLGYIYESVGLLDSAFKFYRKAVEVNPEYAVGYYNIGNLFLNSQNFSSAIQFYSAAIESDSTFIPSFNNRAVSFLKLGNSIDAMKDILVVEKHGYPVDPVFRRKVEKEMESHHP